MITILKKINKSYFLIVIIFLLYPINLKSNENLILFKINNKAFTSLDLEKRIRYLDFVGGNDNLDKETIIEDFISVNIFYEYYRENNNDSNKIKINEIYEKIYEINFKNNKKYKYKIDEENIKYNINLDFIRKTVLEKIINSNINDLSQSKEEVDLLYNFKLKYINFSAKNIKDIKFKILNLDNINIKNIKTFLKNEKIDYFFKVKEINNINKIDKRIKNKILSNKNFFIIEDNNYFSIIFIEKKFETLEGILANIYSIKTSNELSNEYLRCENLSKLENKSNIINKEYKFTNLNNDLKNKLVTINDYVKIINNDEIIYIILCDIKFDKEVLNSINLNKLINSNVNYIEKRFIRKYSKIFNLIKNNV